MYADPDQLELARLADDGCPNVPEPAARSAPQHTPPQHTPPAWSRAEGVREQRNRHAAARGSRAVLEC